MSHPTIDPDKLAAEIAADAEVLQALAENGDIASLVLFGGLGLWAIVEMGLINAAGPWSPPAAGRGFKGDAMNLVGTVVLYGLIAGIHIWLGHNPFLGTYG